MRLIFCSLFLAAICLGGTAKASTDIIRMITAAAQRHGISVSIALRVAKIESGFNCYAQGKAGELGPLQIKPATARLIGYAGAISALRSCGAGLEWGIRHLAMAIKAGGVWKHNQGLWAKSKSSQAAAYEKRVMQASIAAPALSRRQSAEQQAPRNFRGGRPFPLVAASAAERHFP
jgi:transglycosylase-like protein with SLT domain